MSNLHFLASCFGFLGAFLLFVQVVFGSRHIFSFFTKDTVRINKIHKWIGMYGTLFIFAHPLLEMMWQESSFLWIFIPNFSFDMEEHISFGRIALYLLLIIWVTSALVREKIKWRPWKYIHLLAYPTLFFTFIHAPEIGTLFDMYPLIAVVWYSLFFIFIAATFFRIACFAGYRKVKTTIVEKGNQGDGILLLSMHLPEGMDEPQIGQHVYMQTKPFGSEHPFTVMDYNATKKIISFGMRKGGAFVAELEGKGIGAEIFLDGPYGVFTKEGWNTEEKIIIAGGVGVTPFIRLVKDYGKNAIFLYANRGLKDAVHHVELQKHTAKYIDIVEDEKDKGEGVIVGRLTDAVLKETLGDSLKTSPIFICGSPFFISLMKKTLRSLGAPKENIFYEELGF